jgi:hypothetical protein
MNDFVSWKINYGIGLLCCGLLFLFASKTKRWSPPQWVKRSTYIAGFLAIALSFRYFVEAIWRSVFNDTTINYLNTYGIFFGGILTGIVLTLFISGELKLRKPSKEERLKKAAKEIFDDQ